MVGKHHSKGPPPRQAIECAGATDLGIRKQRELRSDAVENTSGLCGSDEQKVESRPGVGKVWGARPHQAEVDRVVNLVQSGTYPGKPTVRPARNGASRSTQEEHRFAA
jgi:hypothetical protein